MENNNQIFKISRDSYGDSTVTYNNVKLLATNRLDLGTSLSFNWGDTSTGSEALAYSILSKVGSKEIAKRYAKLYTKNIISKIQKDDWTLNATSVIQWINENTNYSIDESAYFKSGNITYEYKERRQEERRSKEERRIKREKDFQEEAQRRLKIYETKQQEPAPPERREKDRRLSAEEEFKEKAQKRLSEIQAQYQQQLDTYKKQILKQNAEIEAYQAQIKKYKLYIDSLDI